MNIQEYFDKHKHIGLEEQQKMLIYQDFLNKSQKVLWIHKMRYYTKVGSFALSIGLMAVLGYIIYQPTDQSAYHVAQVGDAIITLESRLGVVQADSIGEIVFAQGDIKILKDDQEVSEISQLWHNDRVLLQPGAVVEFTILDGLAAKIVGPAEFSVEYLGTYDNMPEYGINLIAGDYLEVSSLNDPQAAEQQVVIKTADFHLEKVHTSDEFDLVISTQDGKKMVENSGGEIVIKKLVNENEEKVFVSVKSNQTVQINGDIALLSDEEAEKVVDQLKEQPLAIRYDLESTDTGDSMADILNSTALRDSKVVMDTATAADVARLLDYGYLDSQARQAAVYYFAGNQESFDIALTNMLSRITRTYNVLGLEVNSSVADTRAGTKDLSQGVILVDQLLAKMTESYYIEPAYTTRLRSLLGWIMFLQSHPFGHYSEADEITFDQLVEWLGEEGSDSMALIIQ